MKIVCAWCKREGRDAVLGESEPLDDPTETHSICARHAAELIEQLPSVSFPGIRVLFVVRRSEPALYDQIARSFAGIADIAVLLDRRHGERRQAPGRAEIERRRGNRRIRKAHFSSLGYYVVRFGAERAGQAVEPLKTVPVGSRRRSQ